MPRKLRIESSEGLYHVINRGNYRSYIFEEEGARLSFEKALFECCDRSGWRLHAFCVMTNHFHLCLGTPKGNLSEGMRWLQATYASRFNRFRKESGHLFQGRFKSLVVEPGDHFRDLVDYIHLNPVRAGMVSVDALAKYRWSSLWHFSKRKTREACLDPEWMGYSDSLADSTVGWRRYIQELSLRGTSDPKEAEELDKRMCRGWCLGSKGFKSALVRDLVQPEGRLRLEKDELGDFNRSIWAAALEGLFKELGKDGKSASGDTKSADWKMAIVSKMKRETTATNAWLAAELGLGAPNGVSVICGRYRSGKEKSCPYARKLGLLKVVH